MKKRKLIISISVVLVILAALSVNCFAATKGSVIEKTRWLPHGYGVSPILTKSSTTVYYTSSRQSINIYKISTSGYVSGMHVKSMKPGISIASSKIKTKSGTHIATINMTSGKKVPILGNSSQYGRRYDKSYKRSMGGAFYVQGHVTYFSSNKQGQWASANSYPKVKFGY